MKNHLSPKLSLTAGALGLSALLMGCDNPSRTSNDSNDPNRSASTRTNETRTDVDNTRVNVRDRNDATLTPGDQGNSPQDRDTTIKIRKALVSSTNGFSVSARNVKIITTDGKVTLRGPVKTDAEKTGIATLARSIAGASNVDDQLEVQANP